MAKKHISITDVKNYIVKHNINDIFKEFTDYDIYLIVSGAGVETIDGKPISPNFPFKNILKECEEKLTNKFRFIPKTEITEVTVDGIEGILIKTI